MRRALVAALVTAALAGGCASRNLTNTPRSAIEQLLLSGAVDRALANLEAPELTDRKVFVDLTNLTSYDVEYVRVATRARFAALGAMLVDKAEDADYIAEVASGGLGVEFKKAMVGLPPIPLPNAGIPSPEMPAYRSTEQTGIVKLLIFIHADGKLVAANHYYAKCDRDESFILFWRTQHNDQVREGWERADLENVQRSGTPATAEN